MDRPGTWDEEEAVSAGPIRHPDSGEIGQGKEIGDQEVTQTRGPENCGQNLQDPGRAALGTEPCPLRFPGGREQEASLTVPPLRFWEIVPLEPGGSVRTVAL